MSRRALRWWLFLVAFATVPVPFYLGATGQAPPLRIAFVSSLLGIIGASEGGSTTQLFFSLGFAQILVWSALFFLVAGWIARALESRLGPAARGLLCAGVCAGLVFASFFEIYDTPLSSRAPTSNFFGLFD